MSEPKKVRIGKVAEARAKIAAGFYERPDVLEAATRKVAKALGASPGDGRNVLEENSHPPASERFTKNA